MVYLLSERQGTFIRASIYDHCNFACQYCAADMGMENHTPTCLQAPLLNTEDYIRNMKWLAQHGFRIISFTGGEPLLNPDFARIAEGCRPFFETMEITTNGTKLLENIQAVKKYIDVLKISIDAYDKELAVRIAHNDMARNTMSVIEESCRDGIKKIGFNFVYMKQNEKELPKLIDYAGRLREKYGTDIYISILDLYYSRGNRAFWKEQFVDLSTVREQIERNGIQINRRLRVGCDSYNFICNGIVVNMKDSISCTHRAKICERCTEYCQEGIYSLKHSASGWLSVCPSNTLSLGTLLNGRTNEKEAHEMIDQYVTTINEIKRVDHTGMIFREKIDE
ncbi:MAG: radical SAM protein [Lachnospiraceae bacterium]|nr:radical SAM protein [Lachnospiraceae bacterium]